MKKSIKPILVTFMLLATLFFVTACAETATPYDENDAKGYTVSVKYDANGGVFTTNTSVIVDSYNISGLATNANGKVELGLLSPDDEARKKENRYTVTKNDYFLAGWYAERTESKDSEGNTVYTYGNKWDFSTKTLEVDPNKTYTSSEPVVTLYAAWVPMYEINFYTLDGSKLLGNYTYNPNEVDEILVPEWGEDGAMKMYRFPANKGFTFEAAYYDKEATKPAEGTVIHTGKIDEATGTAENHVMNLYVDWREGEWYRISDVKSFQKYAKASGSYEILADLDFSNTYWPTALMHGNFSGTIIGNGHTISNVNVTQTDNNQTLSGMFGGLKESAKISDLTFTNVTFTIQGGTRVMGSTFGLFAGTISNGATVTNVKIESGILQIDGKAYFANEDYVIGKICGSGDTLGIDYSGIVCKVTGEDAKITITENGNEVIVTKK